MNSNETYSDFFSTYYDFLYEKKLNHKKGAIKLIKLLKKANLSKKDIILDIGCGTGLHALHVAQQGYQTIGIDISPHMIKQAKTKLSHDINLSFDCISIEQFNLPVQHAYALCKVINCLNNKSDLFSFFTHTAKILPQNGYFIFECWNAEVTLVNPPSYIEDSTSDENITIHRKVKPKLLKQENIVILDYYLTLDNNTKVVQHKLKLFFDFEIKALLKEAGFKIVTIVDNIKTQQPLSSTTRETCYITQKI